LRVVGFVGPSGTGKSHRAVWVARERGIDFIIDDGLLIRGPRLLQESQPKRKKTKIGSIKCALFTDDAHADDVKTAIRQYNPEGILILGTSDGMVESHSEASGASGSNRKGLYTPGGDGV